MKRIHKHHIIPRHAGGSDDASNLVEMSIEDHAQAHKELYELYGRWQDKLAWKMLSGQISASEASKEAQLTGARLGALNQPLSAKSKGGKNNTRENRIKAAKARYDKHGHIHSNLTEDAKKRYDEGKSLGGLVGGKKCSDNKLGAFKIMLCYECGKISTTRWIKHHGRQSGHSIFGVI